MDLKKFTLKLKQEAILLDDVEHVVTELTGAQRDEYQDYSLSSMELGSDGLPTRFKSTKGLQSRLVALSVRRRESDGTLSALTAAEVEAWPAQTLDPVFRLCQSLSNLGAKEASRDRVKND